MATMGWCVFRIMGMHWVNGYFSGISELHDDYYRMEYCCSDCCKIARIIILMFIMGWHHVPI